MTTHHSPPVVDGQNNGVPPQAGSGYSAEPEPEEVSAVPVSIPNASALFVQLHYPEAVEALAKAIGPLIVEEFDCEPHGAKWDAISEKDRIVIRYIALSGLNRLITHCHINAASAIEARRAATPENGAVHEHPVPKGDAQ